MTIDRATVHALRTALADSLCAAQAQEVPRTRLQQMRYALSCNALFALDRDSGFDDVFAIRIAVHALIEWRGTLSNDGDERLSAQRRG